MRTSVYDDRLTRRIACLRQVPLFAKLGDADLATLADEFRLREYDKDEIIFHQGDTSRELYVVMEGKVRIFKISPSGNETSIQIFSINGIIGECATVDGRPRSATVRAHGRARVLTIDKKLFLRRVHEDPSLAFTILGTLSQRVRELSDEVSRLRHERNAGG